MLGCTYCACSLAQLDLSTSLPATNTVFTVLLCVHVEPESDVSGIPDFWMHVLQSHKGWSEEVSPLLAAPPASQSVSQGVAFTGVS